MLSRQFIRQPASLRLHLQHDMANFNLCISIFRLFYFQREDEGYWRQHSFKENLRTILGLDAEKLVLNFHEMITKAMCDKALNNRPLINVDRIRHKNSMSLDWSCMPRPSPLAYNDSTHDLPGFNHYSRN